MIHHGVLNLETINQRMQMLIFIIYHQIIFEVEQTGDRLVSKPAQLISNNTTNLSEYYMLIRAKDGWGGNR